MSLPNLLRRVRALRYRLLTVWHRDARASELDEEMAFHRERLAEEMMRTGVAPDAAREAARRRFGNPLALRERAAEAWGAPLLEDLWYDLRFGLRLLARSPLFAVVAIGAIAIGIGVNAACFTFVDALMWRPLPVADPASLVKLLAVDARHTTSLPFSYENFTVLSGAAQSGRPAAVRDVMAYAPEPVALRAANTGAASQASVGCVSDNYFTALGGHAAVGRLLGPADDVDGVTPTVVISDALWEHVFQRAGDVVGRDLVLNGQHVVVAGVASADFVGINPLVPDLWILLRGANRLGITPGRLEDPTNRFLVLHTRVANGHTIQQATAELSPLVTDPPATPGSAASLTRIIGVSLMPSESAIAPDADTMLVVLPALFVVALVLIIASANLGNVLLARALARQREMAVRLATGASRARLLRQLLTESGIIALLGAALGLVLASAAVSVVARVALSGVPTTFGRITVGLHPSWRVIGYTAMLAVVSVLTFGLAPALQVSGANVAGALKGDDLVFGLRVSRSRFRDTLVGLQVSACVFVLVAVGILVHNLRSMTTAPTGLDTAHVIVAQIGLTSVGHVPPATEADRQVFATRVAALGDVTVSARTAHPPFSAWPLLHVSPAASGAALRGVPYASVTPRYFDVTGQRIVEGRALSADDSTHGAAVAVVTRVGARVLWPARSAVGQMLRIAGTGDAPDRLVQIVGVVSDARNQSVREADGNGYLYLPATPADFAAGPMPLVLRTPESGDRLSEQLRAIADQVDADEPLVINTLADAVGRQLLPFQYIAWSAAVIGAFALLLAVVGLYGVVAFAVTQRRRDLAVHIALGATHGHVLALVLRRELRLVGGGLLIGAAASLALVPILGSMTVPLDALPAAQFVGILALLAVVALCATILPARAALRIGPMQVLRQD